MKKHIDAENAEPISSEEYAKLRELRNECLNEVPIKLTQLANRVRVETPIRSGAAYELLNELERYALKLKRMAEEAR